ncbi:MAG TPA: FaeA/PapI family transcriptional regulator [Candidatus Bathyarchaeia archaeon]|nr:FaeA/PapI family transcriptional regulator [Candidatus Bathyarchaeia archaeon]
MLDRLENELEMLERHLEVLNAVVVGEPIGISKLSEMTGHSKYKVRYSLRILEQEGLIKPSPYGAITSTRISKFVQNYEQLLDQFLRKLSEVKTNYRTKRADS